MIRFRALPAVLLAGHAAMASPEPKSKPAVAAPAPAAPEAPVPRAMTASEAGAPTAGATRKRIALTVSGGISFGAYEAGLNWVISSYVKRHSDEVRLDVVTGASAGNINVFLSALDICGVQPPGVEDTDPTHSWYWRAWVPIGLEQSNLPNTDKSTDKIHILLPENVQTDHYGTSYGNDNYLANDGLFTRHAFQPALDEIRAALEKLRKSDSRKPCPMNIGVTLTRVPASETLLGKSIPLPVTRFLAPFKFDTSQPPFFEAYPLGILEGIGKAEGLVASPQPPGIPFGEDLAFRYMMAASAFPYAFGAVSLDYWSNENSIGDEQPFSGDGHNAAFLDGGVFDNIPLGLARSLVEG